nr:MAG TPA: hypothetical protein [Caudoviricetes sp.]
MLVILPRKKQTLLWREIECVPIWDTFYVLFEVFFM